MPDDDERAAPERRTTSDEMLLGYLEDGLRPAEIAVRLGIPVGDVHARIARLTASAQPLEPDAVAPSVRTSAAADSPIEEHHTDSRVPLALLGVVAGAFIVAIAVFLVRESQQAGERAGAIDRDGGSIPPAIVQPTPGPTPTPVTIDGVQLEPIALGAPIDLPRGVAVMVWGLCDQCQRLTAYVQGPLGLESYPADFDLPGDARIFLAAATPDGATVIAGAYWEEGTGGSAVFRSDDGGASWREVWRGPPGWGIQRLGPEHIALGSVESDQLRIIPGDIDLDGSDPLLQELTPLRVFRTIEPESDLDPNFPFPRAWTPDRDRYVVNILPEDEEESGPDVALGMFDAAGKLERGWWGGAALPMGTVLAERVFLSAVLTESGEFVGNRNDLVYLRASIFDLKTATLHPLKLPDIQPNANAFVVSVREGPFLRVPTGVAGCLEVDASMGGEGEPVACAAPDTLLRDTGGRGTVAATDWAEVEVPGGKRGWVRLRDVVLLPR